MKLVVDNATVKFAVARVLNKTGDLDYLQRFEAIHPAGRLSWTTICSANLSTALLENYRDCAEDARDLAVKFVPKFLDGRPIEWKVVEVPQ